MSPPAAGRRPLTLKQIVEGGLCIGCGLCRSLAGRDSLDWVMTPEGRERPIERRPLEAATLERINQVCPGTHVPGTGAQDRSERAGRDTVWGSAEHLAIAVARDPDVRHRGSSAGVLSALGEYLLASGRVQFVLHVAASRQKPLRTEARLSFDAVSVLEGAGSRYGPAAPLADFAQVLDRGQPFALIAKPCDVGAVRALGRLDPRVGKHLRHALTFFCGGASDLSKSEDVARKFGVHERDLTLFRYRGHGNPGPTRLETRDGRAFEMTYREMWEDEATWGIQPRCKICPDSIGESADIVACDVWPGGGPTGETEGWNGVLVRTPRGHELYRDALAAGVLVETRTASFRELDDFQPHQVRKKRAVWARFAGMRAAGMAVPQADELRLPECARLNTWRENLDEARGARRRARSGALREPPAAPRARD
ncbi:MAG TPA: Coenzyme F420 hydrogenase/dehydrogenase, beta subunit C-terminal domain [Steroidobacteraceae bacterium]|nr:Coenzyme F420 hydrogenase/dehydrogenase, beta subunit C-terminal domain [Steroidobacteraceae bacterium]